MTKFKIENLKNSVVEAVLFGGSYKLKEIKNLSAQATASFYAKVLISDVWEYSLPEYKKFTANFLAPNKAFEVFRRPQFINGEPVIPVIAICCGNHPVLLIDSQGDDYARYVGILNFKKSFFQRLKLFLFDLINK